MKKTLLVSVLFCAAVFLPAQEGAGLLDVNKYFSYFPVRQGEDISDNDYVWESADDDYERFAGISGSAYEIDSPLEFALLSYYSQPVVNIRPIEAKNILPANNPGLADLKLGAAVYMDLQVARFTGSAPAPYAAALKFITDRGNVTEADIKKFMRDGIRSALTAEMSKNYRGFVPIEAFNEWKNKGFGDFIGTATDVLVAFFENPTQRNYETVRGMMARQTALLRNGDILASYASADGLFNAVKYINLNLGNKIDMEIYHAGSSVLAKIPDDQRLNVFSIPYARR
jgi:hypothetical protein